MSEIYFIRKVKKLKLTHAIRTKAGGTNPVNPNEPEMLFILPVSQSILLISI